MQTLQATATIRPAGTRMVETLELQGSYMLLSNLVAFVQLHTLYILYLNICDV